MFFIWTVAKDIEGAALLMPLSQLSGPLLKKWLIDGLIWVPDIAEKDEIGRRDRVQRQGWLALPPQQLALFFGGPCLQWANIHHHACHVVCAEQVV